MLVNFFSGVNKFLNSVLRLFGFRRSQNRWGIVYDSISKQPLDPVVVKLIDAATGKVVQTCITDLTGQYGFLSIPGKFKIFAKKTNYNFPSKIVRQSKDGIYENVYLGEFFEVLGDSGVIFFNIPMDPVRPDWNQKAKRKIVKTSVFAENLILKLTSILFWFVFILALLSLYFSRSNFVYGALIFYVMIILMAVALPKPRLWGRVLIKKIKKPVALAVIELSHIKFPDVVIAKALTTEEGKFFLRAQPGRYLLKISAEDKDGQKNLLKSQKVDIGGDGLYNKDTLV